MSNRFTLVSKKTGKVNKIELKKLNKYDPPKKIKKNFTNFLEKIYLDILNSNNPPRNV